MQMEKIMNEGLNALALEKEFSAELKRLTTDNIRTSLFNLVFFYKDKEEYIIEKILDYLFGKRPARIIHIQNCPKKNTSGYVKVRCYPDSEDKQVCFQEIIIQNGQDGIGIALGTWVPMLIHEIPIVVLWFDSLDPYPDILKPISGVADKMIFCTEWNETLQENPITVCSKLAKNLIPHSDFIVSDLTWLKILGMREAAASFFDPPEMRPNLQKLQKVVMTGSSVSEALLFFLWLCSRLDWKLAEAETPELKFHTPKNTIITAQIKKQEKKQVLFITTDGQNFKIDFKQSAFRDRIEKPFLCSLDNQKQLLAELDSLEPDLLYYQALKAIKDG
jgi:glucose-6-phosphate dehydrogenase assembly protein OpcA